MIRKIKKYVYIVSLFCIAGSLSVHMLDAEFAGKFTTEDTGHLYDKGKILYVERGCIGCHGRAGMDPTDEKFPNVGNQSRFYTENQIKDIRDGRRANGGSSMMKASLKGLTDEEAYLISFYLED